MFHGYAVHESGGEPKPFEYDPGPLGDDEIEIRIRHCGLCHSDLSMIDNDWQARQYPLVEHLPLTQVNEALERLRQGKPRYRIVLDMEGV